MGGRIRRSCRWSLMYGKKWLCKLPAIRNPGIDLPTPLEDGCPENCPDMQIVPWKQELYGDDYEDDPTPPQVLEWDEET